MEPTTKVRRPTGDDRAGLAVAAALRIELARLGISATDLNDRLQDNDGNTPDPRYVRRRLQGQTPLSIDDVQWFCGALGVPVAHVFQALNNN
jgi:hypothetical protein